MRSRIFLILLFNAQIVIRLSGQIPTVVFDPQSLEQQTQDAVVQSSIKTTQEVMQRDIEGVAKSTSNLFESFKKAQQAAKTIDGIATIIEDTKEVIKRSESLHSRAESIRDRIARMNSEGFDPYTLKAIQGTLQYGIRSAAYAVKTVNIAIDVINASGSTFERLAGVEVSKKELRHAELKVDSAFAALVALDAARISKQNLIIQYSQADVSDLINLDVSANESNRFARQVRHDLAAEGSHIRVASYPLLRVVFGYADLLIGVIWAAMITAAFRQKVSVIILIQTLFFLTIGYSLVKVIVSYMI